MASTAGGQVRAALDSTAIPSLPRTTLHRRIEPRAFVLFTLAVAGALATAATAWATATSPVLVDPRGAAVWRSLVVACYLGVGMYTWSRRPRSRLGPIIIGAGFVYAAVSPAGLRSPVAYALGITGLAVALAYTAWMYLCYPGGRLESRLERGFIRGLVLSVAVLWGLILLLSPRISLWDSLVDCGSRCPSNGLALGGGDADAAEALNSALNIVFTISLVGVAMLIFRKARSPAYLHRRAMMPLAVVFAASLIEWVIALLIVGPYPGTKNALRIADGVLLLAVPVAVLAGQMRGDIFAGKSLGRIAVRGSGKPLPPPAVQQIIAEALQDSTVRLALWDHELDSYTDVYGAPLTLPDDAEAPGVAFVKQDDSPLAALVHDPTLDTDSDIVEGLVATAAMLREKTRLVEELRASRARIVDTADRERRRLERDLHDGAQNRLMAIQVKLRLAQRAHGTELADLLEAISGHAAEAVDELRALARGIYPSVLRDGGLVDAFRSFAMTAPIRISIDDEGIGRCSPAVETAIYFCSLEAIQNTIKHAGERARVKVGLRRTAGGVGFAIEDDGIGMDTSARSDGVGMMSMRDRIGAVGGTLEIVSARGRGTSVRGTVPDSQVGSAPRQFLGAA